MFSVWRLVRNDDDKKKYIIELKYKKMLEKNQLQKYIKICFIP